MIILFQGRGGDIKKALLFKLLLFFAIYEIDTIYEKIRIGFLFCYL